MLKSLDVLIGLVVVLLALSMAVTVVTQALTAIMNSRGRHLKRGLEDLLQQLDPALTAKISGTIAEKVLTHPLVSASNVAGVTRLGNVIHREEFTKLLMALAVGEGSAKLEATTQQALSQALSENGVENPAEVLAAVRRFAMELERTSPDLANTARQNLAFLHAAPSDLVAKINSWFDQTMDRTSQRFTASTRAITFAGAFVVAFGLQVDTPSIANRLAMDDKMRDAFIVEAKAMNAKQIEVDAKAKAADAKPPDTAKPPADAPVDPAVAAKAKADADADAKAAAEAKTEAEYRAFLADNGIIHLPSQKDYLKGFQSLSAVFGMLVTALLLSLGAPFWYSALGRLLQLRSALAFKDDKQRSERQATTTTPTPA